MVAKFLAFLFIGVPVTAREPLIKEDRRKFYESELFKDVQKKGLFKDSKTFPDMVPKRNISIIASDYETAKDQLDFSLHSFVTSNFEELEEIDDGVLAHARPGEELVDYIDRMWPDLVREFRENLGSLLPLPKASIVPGGRFREIYYWDSLFPFLVLLQDHAKYHMALNILDNAAFLIRKHGYVPNGNRDYFEGRSQPPVLAMIINAVYQKTPYRALRYLDVLEAEYAFWTAPNDVSLEHMTGRTVTADLDGKTFSLQVYDTGERALPRPESWKEDHELPPTSIRHIRASCESGWDFSSRFTNSSCWTHECLQTAEYAPLDVNVFVQHMAHVLAKMYAWKEDHENATAFREIAQRKKSEINLYFWDEDRKIFLDRRWKDNNFSSVITPMSIAPLLFDLTDRERAISTLQKVYNELSHVGGLEATSQTSGEQWDSPFGWAPLQYFFVAAAWRYQPDLAKNIAKKWVTMVEKVFKEKGYIFEKYDVRKGTVANGGEYKTQAGFAFTNAVTLDFIRLIKEDTYEPLLVL